MAVKAEVRSLTGLRGLAALAVALYHVNPELNTAPFIGRFVGEGYLAVHVFFVLSGFVLALNYADGFAPGWSRDRHSPFCCAASRGFIRSISSCLWPLRLPAA